MRHLKLRQFCFEFGTVATRQQKIDWNMECFPLPCVSNTTCHFITTENTLCTTETTSRMYALKQKNDGESMVLLSFPCQVEGIFVEFSLILPFSASDFWTGHKCLPLHHSHSNDSLLTTLEIYNKVPLSLAFRLVSLSPSLTIFYTTSLTAANAKCTIFHVTFHLFCSDQRHDKPSEQTSVKKQNTFDGRS